MTTAATKTTRRTNLRDTRDAAPRCWDELRPALLSALSNRSDRRWLVLWTRGGVGQITAPRARLSEDGRLSQADAAELARLMTAGPDVRMGQRVDRGLIWPANNMTIGAEVLSRAAGNAPRLRWRMVRGITTTETL